MIADRLRSVASRHGEQLAIIDGDQRITYAELIARIDAAGHWLRTILDPQPGDVIAAAIGNSWQFAVCFFAVADLGCIFMPVNPQWRAAELRSLAERLPFRIAIIESRLNSEWIQVRDLISTQRLLFTSDVPHPSETGSAAVPLGASAKDSPVLYVVTSGSTGKPRLVPHSHENIVTITGSLGTTIGVAPGCRFLSVVPAHHFYGFNNTLMLPLLSGATVVMMARFSPSLCAELIHREKIEVLFGSPFIYGSLLDHVQDPALLSSVKWCASAGGRTPSGVTDRWRVRFGVKLRQLYGMSETGAIAVEQSEDTPVSSTGVCVGHPVPGVEVSVLSPDGIPWGFGEIGELALQSPGLMPGYIGEPELTCERFQSGWFRTGDLGYLDASGSLFLTGRMGRVLNIFGVKVDPVELERTIEMLPAVASCHVDTVPNDAGGDVIRARVVPRPGFEVTRREVIEQCRRHLAEYKFPRIIEFLQESPVTLTGKVARGFAPDTAPKPGSQST